MLWKNQYIFYEFIVKYLQVKGGVQVRKSI